MRAYNGIEMKGRLYDYALESRDTDKGEAIMGTVTLQVDDKGTLATVRFYASPKYGSGKPNRTYNILDEMIAGNYLTVVNDGDEADWLAVTGKVDVNYFVGRNGAKTIDDLASAQQIRGLFINANNKREYQNKWKVDVLITGVAEVEANPEKGYDRYVNVSGYIVDDYNERLLNIHFDARKEAAINYMLGLTVSTKEPVFTSAWGQLLKVSTKKVNKNVFGAGEDDDVRETENTRWVVTGMGEPYNFGDEADMSVETYEEYRKNLNDFKQKKLDEAHEEEEDESLVF